MPMQSPYPLQKNIDGAEIGNQVISINVQTLFERLRSDDKNSTMLPELGRKGSLHRTVEQPAVLRRKATMVQRWTAMNRGEIVPRRLVARHAKLRLPP
jgi:hypothetical protein